MDVGDQGVTIARLVLAFNAAFEGLGGFLGAVVVIMVSSGVSRSIFRFVRSL